MSRPEPSSVSRRLFGAQRAVSAVLAAEEPTGDAVVRVLEAVTRSFEWHLSVIWQVARDRQGLRCAGAWSEPAHEAFAELTRGLVLEPGNGLGGRVWQTGEPRWVADIPGAGLVRSDAAAESGLRTAVAVPLRLRGGFVGVLEMMAAGRRDQDPELIDAFSTVGVQVAQVLALAEAEGRLGAVTQSVSDAVVVADAAGTIISWNVGAESMFGHSERDVLGRPVSIIVPARHRAAHQAGIAGAAAAGRLGLTGTLEVDALAADGSEFPVELTLSTWRAGGELLFGGIIRDLSERRAAEASRHAEAVMRGVAEEQAALRRVATEVASGTDPGRVFDLVSRRVADLVGAGGGAVLRLTGAGLIVAGASGPALGDGAIFPRDADSPPGEVVRTGRPARADDLDARDDAFSRAMAAAGLRSAAAAPVYISSRLWGAVVVASANGLPAGAEDRLSEFAYLVALTVANARARERLESDASTDPLTGLANHRAFHESLASEVNRARRHGRELSLALLDIDHFKDVNDTHGHQMGDRVLAEIGRRLAAIARPGEQIARIGGEEFAWILPETSSLDAYQAAERARRAISAVPFEGVGHLSASAGVCDIAHADGGARLLANADDALYWAKTHGRDVTYRYTPEVIAALSESERIERLARSQALGGLRALARAIDAKDRSTQEHSQRVADLACRLASRSGWGPERIVLLRDAALIHDVGKIGVPDAVLQKPGRLTVEEYEIVKEHAARGAEIAREVLGVEQVGWIRSHHERWDGRGYPDGLDGEGIPDGARLLALADSWDVMTSVRAYKDPLPYDLALEECRVQGGTQFAPGAVETLERLAAEQPLARWSPAPT